MKYALCLSVFLLFFFCNESEKKNNTNPTTTSVLTEPKETVEEKKEAETEPFRLTEENAIPFFFEYEKTLEEDHLTFETSFGSFTVRLYADVPYHRANAVYLAKKGYFNNNMFHRVVENFIIQGGNADTPELPKKRKAIGRYLLPPDTDKNHSHHRGVISMPSSDIDNPHKLASPFEFFIVVTKPGSYHLDGDYTAFGEVIEGMEVVDQINAVAVDQGDWPLQNVYIEKVTAFKG